MQDHYLNQLIQWLDRYELGLWDHLDRVPLLPRDSGREVLVEFLSLACQAQHVRNIHVGRTAILSLPREWTTRNIESIANDSLNLADEWEYRRLLEVFAQLDQGHGKGDKSNIWPHRPLSKPETVDYWTYPLILFPGAGGDGRRHSRLLKHI
jgi:hypothetical protein